MIINEEFDCFIDQLHDSAIKDYKTTEHYTLIKEKLEQMERDCETNLTADDRSFAGECFDILLSVHGQEESYVYRRGLHDCVSILKELGVLA